jgi:hypothetical protein
MPRKTVKLPQGSSGPYDAQITIGGGLPYDWDLYSYAKDAGGSWKRSFIRRGSGAEIAEFANRRALEQHVLMWSIAVVNLDDDPLDVDIVVSIRDKTTTGVEKIADTWTAKRETPRLFVTVEVTA